MSVRQVLNEKPAIVIVVVLAVIGAAVWMAVRSTSTVEPGKGQIYFSADDGKTYFADKTTTVTPYTKDGKEVVRAYVYQCKDGKPFVAYLTRQNPNAAKEEQYRTGSASPGISMMAMEYKRPGESTWEAFGKMSAASRAKIKPVCPDGSSPEMVNP